MNKQLLENPLLLVIDMQNVYSNGQKWECSNFNRSLNQIKKLLESNTEEKIIFTKYIASRDCSLRRLYCSQLFVVKCFL